MEDRSSRRMRTLVTRMARRGLSVNEVARALISMMVRSKTAPTRDRIHWCKTAYHQIDEPLATHGRTIHRGSVRLSADVSRLRAHPRRWRV